MSAVSGDGRKNFVDVSDPQRVGSRHPERRTDPRLARCEIAGVREMIEAASSKWSGQGSGQPKGEEICRKACLFSPKPLRRMLLSNTLVQARLRRPRSDKAGVR